MAKRYKIRDKILLASAILGDLFFEIVEPVSIQLGKMKGVLPSDYKTTNFTNCLLRMLRTGYIEKIIKDGEPYIRLTGIGRKALVRDFPLMTMRKVKWDGLWRVVFYDVPEENKPVRERLQAKLKELGFGMIQESVYFTPFDVAEDVREFLIAQHLGDFVFVGVTKKLFTGDAEVLVNKIWGLEKLNERYGELHQRIKEGVSLEKIFSDYQEIFREDPFLPKELLPSGWLGDKVYQEMKKLLKR